MLRSAFLVMAMVVMFMLPSGSYSQVTATLEISGTVYSQYGEPLSGAVVKFYSKDSLVALLSDTLQVETDSLGNYRLNSTVTTLPFRERLGYGVSAAGDALVIESARGQELEVMVYNLLGQRSWYHKRWLSRGRHRVVFKLGALSQGMYFYRLRLGSYQVLGRLLRVGQRVMIGQPRGRRWSVAGQVFARGQATVVELGYRASHPHASSGSGSVTVQTDQSNRLDIVLDRFPLITLKAIETVTEQALGSIQINIDNDTTTTDEQGQSRIYLSVGQHLISIPPQKNVYGLQWPINITTNKDTALTAALIDTAAPLKLYKETDKGAWTNGPIKYYNWSWQKLNKTYIIVNPPDSEYAALATNWLQQKISELDLKGRIKATHTATITDTTTPNDSLELKYGRGQYADISIVWKNQPKAGLTYIELDTSGAVKWAEVALHYAFPAQGDYRRKTVLLGEFFQAFLPSPSDADKNEFPQYQDTHFGDDPLEAPNPPTDWGNGPNGMVQYKGLIIPVEVLKATIKIDYWQRYGNKVTWDDNKMILPKTTIH